MTRCEGKFYDGASARAHAAELIESADGLSLELVLTEQHTRTRYEFSDIELEPPLGKSSPRIVRLPDGARFHTQDAAALEQLIPASQSSLKAPQLLASKLETHRYAILIGIACMLAFLISAYTIGIPMIADSIASKVPQSTLQSISKNTLNVLDRYFGMEPTELSAEQQQHYQTLFLELVAHQGSPEVKYQLEFRSFMPNAFALPSGTIVFSDELIEALASDEAVLAVMAHEMAHVEERHGMRQVLRAAGVAFVLSTFLSDASSLSGVFSALPEMLVSSGYSRNFESEADLYAADYLCTQHGHSDAMIDVLETLRSIAGDYESEAGELISSHPLLEHRIETIQSQGCE